MSYPGGRYGEDEANARRSTYRSNVLWGLPSAFGTLALIAVFQRVLPDVQWLPYVLAPTLVLAVLLLARRHVDQHATARSAGRSTTTEDE